VKYNLVYSRSARKDLKKISAPIRKRIGKKILFYSKEPLHYAKGLTNVPEIGDFRWRIGVYRISFDLRKQTIYVLRIRHRREVYK